MGQSGVRCVYDVCTISSIGTSVVWTPCSVCPVPTGSKAVFASRLLPPRTRRAKQCGHMLSLEKKTISVGTDLVICCPTKRKHLGRDGFGHMLSHEKKTFWVGTDSVICCPTKRKHLGRDGFGHMLSHEKKTFSVGRIRSYAVPRKENIFGREDSVICCPTKRKHFR